MTAAFIPANLSNYTAKRPSKIDRIVVHYTAGDGDTAMNNAHYFQGEDRNASAHYFVDEKTVVQSVRDTDVAWHAGDWAMNCRSIGVEMCSRKDSSGKYYIPEETVKNAIDLVRDLMKKYNIGVDGVIRHYDVTKKACPEPFVRDESKWKAFLLALTKETDAQSGKVAVWAAEAWQKAKQKGVMDGTRPTDAITRQEMAVILQRLNLI